MAEILIILMLLVWIALGVYGKDAPLGCLMLSAAIPILVLMFALSFLVWVSTLGLKTVHIYMEDV